MRTIVASLVAALLLLPVALAAETVDETLVRVRAKYPSMVTAVQSAAILNETAWVHRGEGWAILGKPSGTNCPQPTTAIPISCDYLIHQVNGVWWGWDALIDAGSPGAPGLSKPNVPIGQGENLSEAIKNGARSVVAAVDPGTPPPEPPTPPACSACDDIAALQSTVSRLSSAVEALTAKVAQLDTRVSTLEHTQPPAPPSVVCEEIQESTGRAWGHAHPVSVWKCETK